MSNNRSIPPTLRDLLSRLEFLGHIKQGQKPCMNSLILVDGKSLWGAARRFLGYEGRNKIMDQINKIIDQAINSLVQYQDTIFYNSLYASLKNARNGIENLKIVYKDDEFMLAQITVCINNIDIQLSSVTKVE